MKLFDRPPSKKPGNGLDEGVEVLVELEVLVDVADDEPAFVVELLSVVRVAAVDIVISKVVVTDSPGAVAALLRKSLFLWANIVNPSPSMYGIRVSNKSCSSFSSKMTGAGVCFGFRYQRSSSGANSRSATAVGSGSSSTWDAEATDANDITRPSVVAHRARVTCFGVASKRLWWKKAIVMLQPHHAGESCTASRCDQTILKNCLLF